MKLRTLLMVFSLFLLPVSFLTAGDGRLEEVKETFEASDAKPLEVMLDVDAGEVFVGRSGDVKNIVVSLRFTSEEFRDRIDFDEERNRLRVTLEKRSWWSKASRRDRVKAYVDITLPSGVDIYFDARIKAGEVDMDMGGLRLKEFGLYNLAGEVEVRFDEPNPMTMEMLDVDIKAGEMHLVSLGNARFEKADINGGIGEIDIDFTGDLLDDSKAKVDLDIGEASIFLPDDVGIQMEIGGGFSFLSSKDIDASFYKRGRSYYTEDYDDWDVKFALRITPGLGELSIHRE